MEIGKFYRTEINGYGECSIKVLDSSLLIVSEKPKIITVMQGHLRIFRGVPEITNQEFTETFNRVNSHLNNLSQ